MARAEEVDSQLEAGADKVDGPPEARAEEINSLLEAGAHKVDGPPKARAEEEVDSLLEAGADKVDRTPEARAEEEEWLVMIDIPPFGEVEDGILSITWDLLESPIRIYIVDCLQLRHLATIADLR